MDRLLVKESTIHGTGCFAGKRFRKGEIVGEYTGTRIFEDDADEKYEDKHPTYLFDLDDGTVIDATEEDNPVKYINHSCQPNCESEQRDERVFIIALRDIEPDEELTYDYCIESDDEPEPCSCGAPGCKGRIEQ